MMRLAISRAAAVFVAAAAVAACGSQRAAPPVTTQATPPAAGQNGPAAFITRARQVTAQWERSAAVRGWRTGLVLLDASDLTPIPRDQGFSSQREKDAFGSGHFRLAVTLPAQPLAGMVRWADGTTLRLPLLTARAAFAELAAQRPCGGPYACGQLTVTGAQPGVVAVDTSRGLARVPAWHFTVAGLGWQVSEVAVARSAFVVLPGYGPIPPAGRATPGVSGLTAVSADGRTLTLSFTGSACDAAWGAYRYESSGTVVAGSWERPSAGNTPCPAVGMFHTARVTLACPLGARVVLDAASGLPLVPGFQVP
jgi:hypothetical protein